MGNTLEHTAATSVKNTTITTERDFQDWSGISFINSSCPSKEVNAEEEETVLWNNDKILPSVGTLCKKIHIHSMFILVVYNERWCIRMPKKERSFRRQLSFFAAFFFLLWVLKVFISPIPSQASYVATQVWPSPESGFPGFRVYTLEVVYPENSPSEKSTIILFLQKKSDCCNWLRHWGEFREGKILSPLVKWKAARRTLFPCYCIGPSIAEQEDWFHWKGGNLECQGPHPWGEGGFRTNNKPGCCFFWFEIEKTLSVRHSTWSQCLACQESAFHVTVGISSIAEGPLAGACRGIPWDTWYPKALMPTWEFSKYEQHKPCIRSTTFRAWLPTKMTHHSGKAEPTREDKQLGS